MVLAPQVWHNHLGDPRGPQDKKRRRIMRIECVTKTPAVLGESPVWSVGEQALYWVDITGRALHRFDPVSGEDRDWPLPEEIGCVVPRREGGLIVGLRHGIAFFDPA